MAALNARRGAFVRVSALGAAFALLMFGCASASAMSGAAKVGRPAAQRSGEAGALARWRPYVEEASRRFGIPIAWIERVIMAESGGQTEIRGRATVSSAGAMGLMQLMPGTWADMRRQLGLGDNPHAPRDNILAGTLYLRLMHDRFGYPGLFGAYNSGPARYAAYLAGRQSLPAETRAYLGKVAATPPHLGSGNLSTVRAMPRGQAAASPVADDGGQQLFFIRRGAPARSEQCGVTAGRQDAPC